LINRIILGLPKLSPVFVFITFVLVVKAFRFEVLCTRGLPWVFAIATFLFLFRYIYLFYLFNHRTRTTYNAKEKKK